MTYRSSSLLLLCAALMAVSACSKTKETLGLNRQSPDEFAVIERAPLSVPPDYALRPPRAGTFEGNNVPAQAQARRIILGTESQNGAPATSSATDLVLQKAGAEQAQPNIRATLDKETTVLSTQNKTVAEKLLFFSKDDGTEVSPAEKLDARDEAQKLNKAGISAPTPGQMKTPAEPASTPVDSTAETGTGTKKPQ